MIALEYGEFIGAQNFILPFLFATYLVSHWTKKATLIFNVLYQSWTMIWTLRRDDLNIPELPRFSKYY